MDQGLVIGQVGHFPPALCYWRGRY